MLSKTLMNLASSARLYRPGMWAKRLLDLFA